MPTATTVAATARARAVTRGAVVALAAAAGALALALLAAGPIGLPAGYHDFADTVTRFGVPRAGDVLTNAAFAAAGAWGLWRLRAARGLDVPLWRAFFAAVVLAGPASALYHWALDDAGLLIDRVPIAAAAALLCCLFVAERVDRRAARAPVAAAVVALAVAGAVYAYLSPRWFPPAGDQRPYLLFQFWPLVLIPLFVAWLPRPPGGLRTAHWCVPLALYVLAKAFEIADRPLWEATGGVVSGHGLKHLAAAAAAAVFAWGAGRREAPPLHGAAA